MKNSLIRRFNSILVSVISLGILGLGGQSFAGVLEKFNAALELEISRNKETQVHRFKIPRLYIEDNLIDLISYSENIDDTLRAEPRGSPFSTVDRDILALRNNLALGILDSVGKEIRGGISKDTALEIMEIAYNHSVVGIKMLDKYDPIDSTIKMRRHGFCYGRADYVYFQLRKRGQNRNVVLKLFHVGKIAADPSFGRPWTHHVVTIAKNRTGGWLAIDPFYRFVGTPKEWYEKNLSYIKGRSSVIYIGNPERMFVYGGTHTFPAIMDQTFPSAKLGAAKIEANEKQFSRESRPVKDKYVMEYFSDYFKSLEKEGPLASPLVCQLYEICPAEK
ncbi:MAG: hypothetical protein IPK68_19935 [Bdellovibrionales bacterium]|nr:hypothetical protein [Bdellovibrionales bacterium]